MDAHINCYVLHIPIILDIDPFQCLFLIICKLGETLFKACIFNALEHIMTTLTMRYRWLMVRVKPNPSYNCDLQYYRHIIMHPKYS